MNRETLANASFDEVCRCIVNPILRKALASPDGADLAEPFASIAVLWLLQGTACRSGLGSMVAEEPPWISARVSSSARALGYEPIAALWDEATSGMDFSAWFRASEVRFASPAAIERLQYALVAGDYSELPYRLVEWIKAHAELFESVG